MCMNSLKCEISYYTLQLYVNTLYLLYTPLMGINVAKTSSRWHCLQYILQYTLHWWIICLFSVWCVQVVLLRKYQLQLCDVYGRISCYRITWLLCCVIYRMSAVPIPLHYSWQISCLLSECLFFGFIAIHHCHTLSVNCSTVAHQVTWIPLEVLRLHLMNIITMWVKRVLLTRTWIWIT